MAIIVTNLAQTNSCFADLVWENTTTGERAIWFLKNGVFSGSIYLPTIPVQWHIAGAGDFNG
jgi:hypothetical protein